MRTRFCYSLLLVVAACQSARGDVSIGEQFLISGNHELGETTLVEELRKNPSNNQLRFELGFLRMIGGSQKFAQSYYKYGALGTSNRVPLSQMLIAQGALGNSIPENPNPEKISYQNLREVLKQYVKDLERAIEILDKVDGEFDCPLHPGLFRFDLTGDGRAETVGWQLASDLFGAPITEASGREFVIHFDRSDALWLRAYCHVMAGVIDTMLAYDAREFFERVGYLFFAEIETPHTFLKSRRDLFNFSGVDIVDLIAAIHLINFPVMEPDRSRAALKHWKAAIADSRLMCDSLLAETDDNHEWVPGPTQTALFPNLRMTREQFQSWREVLTEMEAVLDGKKLIPFWRGNPSLGVNMKRVFEDPRTFDLVMWVHGSGVTPFLETGDLTGEGFWNRANRSFRGNLFGFAFLYN